MVFQSLYESKGLFVWFIQVSVRLQCFVFLHNLHNGHNNCNTYMTAAKISRGEIIQILPSGKVMPRKTCQDLKVNPHEN